MSPVGVAGVAVGAIAVLEILLRVYQRLRGGYPLLGAYRSAKAKTLAYESHPYALYTKRPNAGGLYPSNNLGYGGTRPLSRQKARGAVRIYCAGGSTTEQHDPDRGPNSSWPAQLQDCLGSRFAPTPIECVNAGMSGYTSAESLSEFLFRGVDLSPDVLLVYHNLNDAWTCQMVRGFRADYSHARRHKSWSLGWINRLPQLPHVRLWEVLRGRLSERFGKAQSLLYWISDPPWDGAVSVDEDAVWAFRRNVTSLVAAAQAWGCVPVLIKWECDWMNLQLPPLLAGSSSSQRTFREYLDRNNGVLQEIGRGTDGCHYLDVGPFETRHFESDGIHFSGEGLSEMARRVSRDVEPIVKGVLDSRGDVTRI
jgi:lysophospholipase L1-like esterase